MTSLRLDEFESIDSFMEAVKTERRGYSAKNLFHIEHNRLASPYCRSMAMLPY